MRDKKDCGYSLNLCLKIVTDIIEGNLLALVSALAAGWDIHEVVENDEYSEHTPLELALVMCCFAKCSMVSRTWC